MRHVVLALALVSSSCATNTRTKYQPMTQEGGYADKMLKKNEFMTRFAGNAHTHPEDAKTFTFFRSIEVCKAAGKTFPVAIDFKDLTQKQTITRTSNYSYRTPTDIYGTANTQANSNYNVSGNNLYQNTNYTSQIQGQVTGGNQFGGAQTWNETYIYPTYDYIYRCENSSYKFGVTLKIIQPDEIRTFTKDSTPGLLVTEITENSPNYDKVQVGDVIIKVRGRRVADLQQIQREIKRSKTKENIQVEVIREGERQTLRLKATDWSDEIIAYNNKIIGTICSLPDLQGRPICSERMPSSN